jgi:hypothetical protein
MKPVDADDAMPPDNNSLLDTLRKEVTPEHLERSADDLAAKGTPAGLEWATKLRKLAAELRAFRAHRKDG